MQNAAEQPKERSQSWKPLLCSFAFYSVRFFPSLTFWALILSSAYWPQTPCTQNNQWRWPNKVFGHLRHNSHVILLKIYIYIIIWGAQIFVCSQWSGRCLPQLRRNSADANPTVPKPKPRAVLDSSHWAPAGLPVGQARPWDNSGNVRSSWNKYT